MDIVQLISTVVATAALTLGIVKALMKYKEGQPSIKAKLTWGFLTYAEKLSDPMLLLEAANTGRMSVTLSSHALRMPDAKQLISFVRSSNVDFPHELLPGKSCTVWMAVKEVAGSLKSEGYSNKVELKAVFNDQTGATYTSKSFELDVEKWSKGTRDA